MDFFEAVKWKYERKSFMKYIQMPLGPLQTNCYILQDDDNNCIIFDPGEESSKLIAFIKEKKLKPLAVLLTHAHFDHIGALDDVRDAFQIPAYIHEKENKWLSDSRLNGSVAFLMGQQIVQRRAEELISKEGTLTIGDFTFEVLETPGHSIGSVSYYVRKAGFLFSGDVLFQGSIGRTDLPGGSMETLMSSIRTKLVTLPKDTIVFPGHGPITTIEEELEFNPFLRRM